MSKPLPQDLLDSANQARDRAYAPYSQYRVGSAIRLTDGRIFGGCNVENASYGASNCAERVAIQKAVSESDAPIRIQEVLIVNDSVPPGSPCGICRQVIGEFAASGALIHTTNLKNQSATYRFEELLPHAFTPEHLKDRSG